MTYTPESLRARAARYDRGMAFPEDTRDECVDQLLGHAAALEKNAEMTDLLSAVQWGATGYCPACGGWNADPKDPKRGCTPKMHTKTCPIAIAIKGDKP